MTKQAMILILDFGEGASQKLARKIRKWGIYAEIAPHYLAKEEIELKKPHGLVWETASATVRTKTKQRLADLAVPMFSLGEETEEACLKKFLFEECACPRTWSATRLIQEQIIALQKKVGPQKVLCALSGGVDSSVAAVLVQRALGDQLTCVFVDHGFLRKGEATAVKKIFEEQFQMNLVLVDARTRFLQKIKGVSDPEEKRKLIGTEFIRVFEDEAAKLGKIDFLVQGTVYPDVLESGVGLGGTIKSHHNVGGLPKDMEFRLLEPLRQLFKNEVREVGRKLGLPSEIIKRQPFPGPGLAIRIIGEVTAEKLTILREADAIVLEEIRQAKLYDSIWQSFAVLPSIRSVGVQAGERTYAYPIILRAVTSDDAMTASWARLPYDLLERITERIVQEVPQVNRVVYDLTSKPPGTIEWE